jgi:hypothetical protein
MEKGLGPIGRAQDLGKTKPIPGPGRLAREATILSCQDSIGAPGAQTKPIGEGDRAKQSQSTAARCTNKANLPPATTKKRWRAGPQQNKTNLRPSG